MKRFFKKGDVIILAAVLLICLLLFVPRLFSSGERLVAKVYEDGVITHEIDLSAVTDSYEIEIKGAVLTVENGAVSYKEADCPDKICVRVGRLTRAGDTASCVPNATVVTLSGAKNDKGIDVITY